MLRVVIVEDWDEDIELLKSYLTKYSQENTIPMEISVFRDGMSFLDEYKPGKDLVLMDIQMPHMDGMQAAKKLREIDRGVCLIFVTNMGQYAFEGYDVDAMDFLLKPFIYPHFCMKLDRALQSYQLKKNNYYTVTSQNHPSRIPVMDIMYLESNRHYLIFKLKDGSELKARGALKSVQQQFDENLFVRCHASYLVNLEYIRFIEQDQLLLENDDRIPVSRNFRQKLMDSFTRYVGGKF